MEQHKCTLCDHTSSRLLMVHVLGLWFCTTRHTYDEIFDRTQEARNAAS